MKNMKSSPTGKGFKSGAVKLGGKRRLNDGSNSNSRGRFDFVGPYA